MLSFTAEELWQYLPGEHNDSVMLNAWYDGLAELPADQALGREFWNTVMGVKEAVNKELENLRSAKAIRGNLEAEVTLFVEPALSEQLAKLGDELRFVLITSQAALAPLAEAGADAVETELPGLKLRILKSTETKCARCWHFRADVGTHAAHPEICSRCVDNIEGAGEVRQHA